MSENNNNDDKKANDLSNLNNNISKIILLPQIEKLDETKYSDLNECFENFINFIELKTFEWKKVNFLNIKLFFLLCKIMLNKIYKFF